MKRIIRKLLKVVAWIIGIILFLILLVLILIQIPAVQNFAKNKAVAYLEKKIKTKVSVDRLSISFPKEIVLNGVYFEDQKKDTLLYGKEIRVDIALFDLLKHEVNVNYCELDGIKTHLYRVSPDTVFNYDYIVKAFAGVPEKQPQPTDTSGGMKFDVNHVVFKDILVTFKDDNSGNDVYFYLGNFDTRIKSIGLDKSAYAISHIQLSDVVTRVHQYAPLTKLIKLQAPAPVANVARAETNPSLKLDELILQNINVSYLNDISGMVLNTKVGDFITHPKTLDLQNTVVELGDINLNNTTASVAFNKFAKTVQAENNANTASNTAGTASAYSIKLDKINLNNEDITYNDNTQPRQKSGMDYSHLHVQNLQFAGNNLIITQADYKGTIQKMAMNEQSGFALQNLHTDFYYGDTAAYLKNLLLQAGRTLIKDKIVVKYPSIATISKHIGDLYVDADLKNSAIDTKDILIFAPQLKSNLNGNTNTVLNINTRVQGFVKSLSIPVFQASGIGNTDISLSGKIDGLPDAGKAYYDINIAMLKTTARDINSLVPPKTIPSNIRIPQLVIAKGYFRGNAKQLQAQLQLNSSSGNAFIKGSLRNEAYTATVKLDKLNVGYLTKQEDNIGSVTLTANAKGDGFNMQKAVANISAQVQSAELKGYTYRNLVLTGNTNNGNAGIDANMQDSNLRFALNGSANLTTQYPSAVKLFLQLDTININKLNLSKDTMGLHGTLVADLPSANLDSLVGKIFLSNISLTTPKQTISPDSIAITANANGLQKELNINSDFLKADLAGQYKFTGMGQALEQTINQYYNIQGYKDTSFVAEDWALNATFIPTPFILQLIPAIKGTDSLSIHTAFNSQQHNLNAAIKSKRFMYSNNRADSVNLTVNSAGSQLDYVLSAQGLSADSSFSMYRTTVSGHIANNKVDLNLAVDDAKNTVQYNVAGTLEQVAQGIRFGLKPDSLLIDGDKWAVGKDNYIEYDSSGLLVNNFNISNDSESLSINSQTLKPDAPLAVNFKNFQLATFTKIANKDSLKINGVLNGNALLKNATTNPVFTSDLNIQNLIYQADTIGTVALKVNNEKANALAADMSIEGNNNDIRLNGLYYTDSSRMDLRLAVNRINLAAIKPFAQQQLTDATGFVKANVAITGTVGKPHILGNINFINAIITPAISGEPFKLSDDSISIDDKGIHLNNFALLDSANNKALISGDILTTDFTQFKLRTSIDAQNFVLINAPKNPNKTFYGKLDISAHIKVSGDLGAPEATGLIKINPETDFVYVRQENDPALQERDGVVEFVYAKHRDTIGTKPLYDTTVSSAFRGMNISINISTDSSAKLTMIVDPTTGDALTVQGIANLNGGVDRSGKTTLTGSYQLTQGTYQVSISALKREFIIQNGSSITWTGDPTQAQVNIKAIYFANAPSIDLVQQQIIGPDLTRFKQVLPFQVVLGLQGDLLQPIITFDVNLPEELLAQWPDVDLRLQQVRTDPSELNKQVFALLLLGRFLQEDPFASGGGSTTAEDFAVQTISKILADQLTDLAGSTIKGVKVNFSIISGQDYSTGNQLTYTDVNVAVSKKFMSNRLVVTLGSDVGLQGPADNAIQIDNSNVSGNFSANYKLTKDGRYQIVAYRHNDYEEIIVGQVVETGTSFIVTMDYDKFGELFKKKKNVDTEEGGTNGIDHTQIIDKDKKTNNGAPPVTAPQTP